MKQLMKEMIVRWGIRHVGVASAGSNLLNQPWFCRANFNTVKDFDDYMDLYAKFLQGTKGVPGLFCADDCTGLWPSHIAGGVGLAERTKRFDDDFTSIRTTQTTVLFNAWTVKGLTQRLRDESELFFGCGGPREKHMQRHNNDKDKNEMGIKDIQKELLSDLDYLNIPKLTQNEIACCMQSGHEQERKRLLEYSPKVGDTVFIIKDGGDLGKTGQVTKTIRKTDGSLRYEVTMGNGYKMTKVKRADFTVGGQFSGCVFVKLSDPKKYIVTHRDDTFLDVEWFMRPKVPVVPSAFDIQVDAVARDTDGSSTEGETEDEAGQLSDDNDAGDEEANADVLNQENADELAEAEEKHEGEALDGIKGSDESESSGEEDEEEEEAYEDEQEEEEQACASATVSLCHSNTVHASHTVRVANRCMCVCVCRYRRRQAVHRLRAGRRRRGSSELLSRSPRRTPCPTAQPSHRRSGLRRRWRRARRKTVSARSFVHNNSVSSRRHGFAKSRRPTRPRWTTSPTISLLLVAGLHHSLTRQQF
jgi:hypothetical protein